MLASGQGVFGIANPRGHLLISLYSRCLMRSGAKSIRTFVVRDLKPGQVANAERSPQSAQMPSICGGVRGVLSRTNFELNCVVGLPGSRWRGEAFAVEPFQLPLGYLEKIAGSKDNCQPKDTACQHPIHLAQGWAQELANTPGFTITQIAEREGVSRSHVRGVLRLSRLPSDVQQELSSLSDSEEISFYSERRLRRLVYLSAKEQREGFAKLRQRWEAQSRK